VLVNKQYQERFLTFPAQLFEKVFKDLLPSLKASWYTRNGRPIPESVRFTYVLV
jgi:hypothetical protein